MSDHKKSNLFVDIFASPVRALTALNAKPRFVWALLILLAASGIVQLIYYSGVDVRWFFQAQMAANPNTTQAQAESMLRMVTSVPQGVLATIFMMFTWLIVAISYLIIALYFKIVSLITKDGLTYGKLFSLVVWTSLPALIALLAQAIKLLSVDITMLPINEINPLSFWQLFGLTALGTGTFDQIVMGYDPTTIWSLALLVIGYKIFTGKSYAVAAIIALIPTALTLALALAF